MSAALKTAIVREMPEQPTDGRAWFVLFLATANEIHQSMLSEFGTGAEEISTIRALNKIIKDHQIS